MWRKCDLHRHTTPDAQLEFDVFQSVSDLQTIPPIDRPKEP